MKKEKEEKIIVSVMVISYLTSGLLVVASFIFETFKFYSLSAILFSLGMILVCISIPLLSWLMGLENDKNKRRRIKEELSKMRK